MNGKKHEITESDMMRVENKLNSAMHDRLQNRTKDVTKTKIQNLHNFFDEMENEEESRTSSRNQSNVVISEAKDKDHLSTLSQTKGVITGLKVELNETKNNLEAVKKKLEDERATFKEKETDFINKLSMKEREFNSEIQGSLARQHEIIEKLVNDKKILSEQVSSLMSQLKMMDDKNTRVIVDIKNKFKSDMKDAKEAWMAVEKSKREKWKVEKEKEIKEGTIRGLEPELERMLQKQREEKRKMEEDMSEKVKTEKIRLEAEYMDRLSDFKRKLIEENEAILRKEKDFMASHYESLVKDSGREHQAQLKGLEEKIRKEVEEESIKKRREIDYYEDRIGKIQKDHVVAVQKLKGEFEVEKKELREKYEEERCRFKGSMGEEEKTMRKRVEEEMILIFEKKNEHLREKLTKERDEQIQMIVDRLIKEKTEFVESALNAERHKFKQKKDQYSDELDDLKSELTMYKERLVNEQQRCHKAVVDKDTLEKKVEILVKENEEQRENIYRLKSRIKVLEEDIEKDKLTIKAMERSFQEQLDFERGKARTGVNDRYELEEKHRREKEMLMTDLEERQVKELEALEKRIKVILDRKDREIGELREEVLEKEGLCQKYEDLLERQRKEILGSLN